MTTDESHIYIYFPTYVCCTTDLYCYKILFFWEHFHWKTNGTRGPMISWRRRLYCLLMSLDDGRVLYKFRVKTVLYKHKLGAIAPSSSSSIAVFWLFSFFLPFKRQYVLHANNTPPLQFLHLFKKKKGNKTR